MTLPDWKDPKLGSLARVALWLAGNIGEQGIFTKTQLRLAFPTTAQADRRVRDLRPFGWVIDTRASDATLKADEQRVTKIGIEVWNAAERITAGSRSISNKERKLTFAADDYQCVICGISGGEVYPESMDTAVLGVARRETLKGPPMLVTECKRCRAGTLPSLDKEVSHLVADVQQLSREELTRLFVWVERGRRSASPLDRLWNSYRRLPGPARKEFLDTLAKL